MKEYKRIWSIVTPTKPGQSLSPQAFEDFNASKSYMTPFVPGTGVAQVGSSRHSATLTTSNPAGRRFVRKGVYKTTPSRKPNTVTIKNVTYEAAQTIFTALYAMVSKSQMKNLKFELDKESISVQLLSSDLA